MLVGGSRVLAAYEKYAPGDAVTVGEFVYEDDFTASTDNCFVNVYNPAGAQVVNGALMTADANGWHHYTFTPDSVEGIWPTTMYCGTIVAGDLAKIDKSFVLGYISASTTSIADAVWQNGQRTLTSKTLDNGESLSTESFVNVATSTLGSKITDTQNLISSLHNITAADVWSYAGRDLDNPTIVTASTSAAVWEKATLSLSSAGSIGKLIIDNLDVQVSSRGTSMLTAADVWNAANRTLTDYSTSTIASAIWNNANRTLTYYGNDITAADVWDVLSNTINVEGSIGKQLKDNTDAKISTIPDLVWTSSSRLLTDYATSSIATAVWNNPTRSLTSFGTLVADIWSDLTAPNRKLTSATLTGGGSLVKEDYLSTSLESVSSTIITQVLQNKSLINNLNNISADDVWSFVGRDLDHPTVVTASTSAAVWEQATNTFTSAGSIGKLFVDNLDVKVSTRGTSMLTAADVWDAANRTLTDYSTSSIALGVWSNSARTLTNYGNDITAADVWNVLTNTLLNAGSIGKQLTDNVDVKGSTIVDEIQQNRALINGLNFISAADVWSYAGRDLDNPSTVVASTTAAVWNTAINTLSSNGSIGKLFVDNLDAKISTRSTSSITAADVWSSAERTLSDYSTSTITQAIWANANRTLTSYGNDITAQDVWSVLTNTLLNAGSVGKLLVDNVDVKGSTIVDEVQQNRALINGLSSISAADVWSYAGRDLDNPSTVVASTTAAVWNTALNTLSANGSIGKLFVDNLDAKVSTRGTSSITAADVWSVAERTLTDYSTSTITDAIWANANRTLTSYGNDITAQDVWNVLTNTLVNAGSIGKQLTQNVDVKGSTIVDEIQQNRLLINNLHNISAADVWNHVGRDLDTPNNVADFTSSAVWDKATNSFNSIGSVGKLFVDNLDAKISTRGTSSMTAADVWNVAERTLTDYSTSTITDAIWANANRTLTSYGNDITGADVWNVLTNTLLNAGSIGKLLADNIDSALSTRASLSVQQAGFTVQMSDASSVAAGKTYRAKLYVLNSESIPTDSNSRPVITLYDAERNIVANGVNMGKLSNGVYEYTYLVANGATPGLWEAAVSTEVSPGKTIETNDFWVVEASPAQVIINGISDDIIPLVASNITITNEGLSGYEYHYEWCVVANAGNACGGNDDVFYASAAKFINPGDDWNTTLTATVPNAGNYFFKLVVYFGTDHSSASRLFAAVVDPAIPVVVPPAPAPSSGGGGGGGGGGGSNNQGDTLPVDSNKPQASSNTFQANEGGTLKASTPNDLFLDVTVPAKALTSPSTITATPVASASQPASLAGLRVVGDMMFDLNSSNGQESFGKPIVLTFSYTDEQIQNFSEDSLKVYWYDEKAKKWVALPTTLYPGKNMIMAETIHFSLFSVFGKEKVKSSSCQGADFNHDKKVNSIDFSILLAFWKTSFPFKNACVDLNSDKSVNSVDFSILMYEWGSKK